MRCPNRVTVNCFSFRIKSDLSEYQRLLVNRSDFEDVTVIGRGHFGCVTLVREKNNPAKVWQMHSNPQVTKLKRFVSIRSTR